MPSPTSPLVRGRHRAAAAKNGRRSIMRGAPSEVVTSCDGPDPVEHSVHVASGAIAFVKERISSLAIRFSMRDILAGLFAVSLMLGACRLLPTGGFIWVSVAFVSSGTAWHSIENEWFGTMLAATYGAVAVYVGLLLVLIFSQSDLGAFPSITLALVGPFAFVVGGVIGGITRIVRQAISVTLSREIGMKGVRGFTNWIGLGYLIVSVLLLAQKL